MRPYIRESTGHCLPHKALLWQTMGLCFKLRREMGAYGETPIVLNLAAMKIHAGYCVRTKDSNGKDGINIRETSSWACRRHRR